jgi:hypothetical protein
VGKIQKKLGSVVRLMLYEMLHCVIWLRFTIVYEEPAAALFQVEELCILLPDSWWPQSPLNVDVFMSDYITSHSKG